jgi:hypothetical protein
LVVLGFSQVVFSTDKVATLDSVAGKSILIDFIAEGSASDIPSIAAEDNKLGHHTDVCSEHSCSDCANNCRAGYSECCDPQWTVTVDALFLRPSASTGQQLLFDPLEGANLFNSSDAVFPIDANARLSLVRHGQSGWDFEFNYFDIISPKTSDVFPASALPGGIGSLSVDNTILLPVNDIIFEERFRLYSSEFNLQKPVNEWLTILVGFRWVEFFDDYLAQGVESVASSPFSEAINTHNHLYGFQIGENARLFERAGRLHINGFAKLGIFYNVADQNSNFYDPAIFGELSAVANGSHTAFLCELGLVGTYQLTHHVALRGGYQVLWIEGVALAPGQIPVTSLVAGSADIASSGAIFYHGANAGLEISW